ncbi:MAG TPA: polysaccharide biosynthesis/export family protein [Pyrinomonadaceae bacterium]|nr:polysaccharide biosynthesis/export family protein [Pyrinomonadaceae bacterium]
MKRILFLFGLLSVALNLAAAQTQTRERRSADSQPEVRGDSTAVRNRVVGPTKVANHSEGPKAGAARQESASSDQASDANAQLVNADARNGVQPSWGETAVVTKVVPEKFAGSSKTPNNKATQPSPNAQVGTKLIQHTALIRAAPSIRLIAPPTVAKVSPATASTSPTAATASYRVGVDDVLDVRLANAPTRESTLFTILKDGTVEYPLLSGPVVVAGLTTDEIAGLLSKEIKVIAGARATVSVRDYASHVVVVTGLVDNPGRKTLRRESMPLYSVLAEALPRPEASVATILRAGKEQTVSLADEKATSTLILPGDVLKIASGNATPKRFLYVGGDVASPGEKEFREGMTLTQALLSAGGDSRGAKITVKVARRNANGFLVTNEFSLQSIVEGKLQDPLLMAGDRIEVARGVW